MFFYLIRGERTTKKATEKIDGMLIRDCKLQAKEATYSCRCMQQERYEMSTKLGCSIINHIRVLCRGHCV